MARAFLDSVQPTQAVIRESVIPLIQMHVLRIKRDTTPEWKSGKVLILHETLHSVSVSHRKLRSTLALTCDFPPIFIVM